MKKYPSEKWANVKPSAIFTYTISFKCVKSKKSTTFRLEEVCIFNEQFILVREHYQKYHAPSLAKTIGLLPNDMIEVIENRR